MPIIEAVSQDAPLSQGDLLKGIPLFATDKSWETEGIAATANKRLCLVISRPCVAAHKTRVIVAAVEAFSSGIPTDVKSFSDVQQFLTGLRDGDGAPDVFYLGEISDHSGRFCAKLDSLHTLQIPEDEKLNLQFLKERRIGRLHEEYVRDLHIRIFKSFASLGFDDTGWLSDADLLLVLHKGQSELAAAQQLLAEKQAAKLGIGFSGKRSYPEKEITDVANAVKGIEALLQPYRDEHSKRARLGN